MSRPLRVEYEGAWYHVMNRGANRKIIFHKDEHRELFLELLEKIYRKFKIEIHAYCLMSNHYHLLVKTPLANLQRAMRNLNGLYAQSYNRERKTDGPLFRGRYKAIVVDKENYLLRLSRYIHLNPVEAKICSMPEDYKWSSYSYYIGKKKKPNWLFIDEIWLFFGNTDQAHKYNLFVNEGVDDETIKFYQKIKKIPIIGTEEFVKTITQTYLKYKKIHTEISEGKMVKQLTVPLISDVMRTVSEYYNIDINILKQYKKGKANNPRAIAMYLAAEMCQTTLSNIAIEFDNISYGGVSNACKRILTSLAVNNQTKKDVSKLMKLLQDKT